MSIRAPFLLLGLIAAGSAYAAPTLLVDALQPHRAIRKVRI